jgi:predicted MPP superfamily phosphohydrolase
MSLFLISFLTLYGGMHLLVFWGCHPLLKGHPALPTLTWIWMGLMIFSPILVRLLDRNGYELTARALAWIGYSWMGVLFLAFALFTLLGCWELLRWGGAHLISGLALPSLHTPASALIVLLLVLAAGFYGLYEANDLRVETVRIETAKLPAGTPAIRIAQVSDLHLGLIHREEALAPIIARLRQLQPDLLLATGDIVDAQINHLDELVALWQQFDPPLGKFAVTGNHEFYAGLEQALDFMHRSGFTVLRNRDQLAAANLRLVGVDDPTSNRGIDEPEILQRTKSAAFTILLKHRPRFEEASAGLFDLQLSGHAHRGQIFPFNLLTGIAYPMQDGLYTLPQGAKLYASRGTGTWGPPMRICAPPEITLFEIVPRP